LQAITRLFFERLWQVEQPKADCLLFDTTNYSTCMASQTPSDLAQRGKNKAGKHHLRQIGLGLLVARDSGLPLYSHVYPGNAHDSKLFAAIMDEMFGIVCGLDQTKERLTVVIDKGMNGDDNYAWIDEHPRIHFITTCSTYFAQELAATPLHRFKPVDTAENRRLREQGRDGDCLLAYRTSGVFWGKERSVIVTYTPASARKQAYTFADKLEALRQELLVMRAKVREQAPHWEDEQAVQQRYLRCCEHLHLSTELYDLSFTHSPDRLTMNFRKDLYQVGKKEERFGKNIIITDNTDWPTGEIIEASLARWQVEDRFRLSKDDELVGTSPIRHWTDSKIRCHLFTCVVAMAYLRRIELKMAMAGHHRSAATVIEDMPQLHYVLQVRKGRRTPERRLETPTKTQREVLSAWGYTIDQRGVLQSPVP
jgi:transposase